MSDMLNIGKSGMLTYKTALTVTSENVANANTDGYSRRSVITSEVTGGNVNPFYNSSTGHGVLIDDVRRAFDELVVAQVRSTTSGLSSAETMLPAMEQLEDRLLPDAGGVTEMLDGFFESVEGLASLPSDRGMRTVLIENGKGLARAVADMGTDIQDLGEYLHAQGSEITDRINGLLTEVHKLQDKLGRSSIPGADNAALDRRDALLTDLSELIEINVSYSDNNIATVRMGDSPQGPLLVDAGGPARITLNADLSLNIRPSEAGSPSSATVTRTPSGGRLHGLATALSAVNATLTDVNVWAATLTDQMNTIHQSSRDENGAAGAALFSLNGWDANPAAHNQGTALAVAAEVDGETVPGDIELRYDSTTSMWNAYDGGGTLLSSGSTQITLPGMVIDITGTGVEGDIIQMEATHGQAKNMQFKLDDPSEVASGGAVTIVAPGTNTSTATLDMQPDNATFVYQPEVSSLLPANGTAVDLLSAGVVGVIPAGASEVTLASLSTGGGSPSDIMVFTREGTQIAGPALSGAAASALLTGANGFADGAVYDGSLTGQADNYLGTQLSTDGSDAGTQWLRLTDLPHEDLIVVAGAGALELGGVVTQGNGTEPDDVSMRLEVVNAGTGEVRLIDQATGHRLGGGTLDANGQVSIAGNSFTVDGTAATGDVFDISSTTNGTGDGRGLTALAALRRIDHSSGMGGFQSLLTEIRTEVGGVVAGTESRVEVARAQNESALTAQSAAGGVDLDSEAAALMQYQQAYQANARIMTVAREIFQSLLQSL